MHLQVAGASPCNVSMLPELIAIHPPAVPPVTSVVIPGSKSLTNRALILAALSSGTVTLKGALASEDTEVMTDCLTRLGFALTIEPDPDEAANRTITVEGKGGVIPNGGTPAEPLQLYVGNAGTAARFLSALLCLGNGSYRLSGVPRMHERPQSALFAALRQLGYHIETPNDRLPAVVHGTGPRPGAVCSVSVVESSQFASALLLAAGCGEWDVNVTGANPDELPYVEMTRAQIKAFPFHGGTCVIEPDASSATYFWGADWLLRPAGGEITVSGAPASGWQIDGNFFRLTQNPWPARCSRSTDLADGIMTAIAMAPFAPLPSLFTDLGRLRLQECERVAALKSELTKCGAVVTESGNTLAIQPGPLRAARIATYHDHRIAMCFAILGLRVPGMEIEDPGCVRKTFPNFFAKLSDCGAIIQDASGHQLSGTNLLA